MRTEQNLLILLEDYRFFPKHFQKNAIKKNLSNSQYKTEILVITLLVVLFSLTGTAINFAFAYANGFDLTRISGIFVAYPEEVARNFFRTTAAIHQIFTFLLPCLIFWWIFKRKEGTDYFKLGQKILPKAVIFSALFFMTSMPLVGLSAWFNQLLPLPKWAINMEADTAEIIATLLSVDTTAEWLLNLLVIAAIPAISEEIFFRGIVQNKLVGYFKNPHLAIWLGALFFSAFHFQFEGFFPRMVLGAVLGYLYYWSINLWIPIILHFFNNAILVSAPYFALSDQIPTADTDLTLSYSLILSALGAMVFGYFLIKNRKLFLQKNGR